jgi:hypothetical protein
LQPQVRGHAEKHQIFQRIPKEASSKFGLVFEKALEKTALDRFSPNSRLLFQYPVF